MKKALYILGLCIIVFVAFQTGAWHGKKGSSSSPDGRKVLYYIDPMNPSHTSKEPGLAPCGMKMEPVYADSSSQAESGQGPSSMMPGTVGISTDKQQLIGVRTDRVQEVSQTHTIRLLGTIAPDETLIYRINTSTEGWIRDTYENTTGSIVKKDEPLASFYSREFLTAEQAYFYALNTVDKYGAEEEEEDEATSPAQLLLSRSQVQSAIDTLLTLGMNDIQIKELARSRQFDQNIIIRSPATAFVLERNVTPGLRFERGVELYRLADLSRVWVLADLFEYEVRYVKPGTTVKVSLPHQGKAFEAKVTDVLPAFDTKSRTLKVRLVVNNPEFVLRPDMFVDVELPVELPNAITVPEEAILDTGTTKTVFIDKGNGYFEPKRVEIGWRVGGKVQIIDGLSPDDRIVVSGNFLLDSESKMKLAASGIHGEVSQCPFCGMEVSEDQAKAAGLEITKDGKTFYFCSPECKEEFAKPAEAPKEDSVTPSHNQPAHPQQESMSQSNQAAAYKDIVCGMVVDPKRASTLGLQSNYLGTTYSFCSKLCKNRFDNSPDHYVKQQPPEAQKHEQAGMRMSPMGGERSHD